MALEAAQVSSLDPINTQLAAETAFGADAREFQDHITAQRNNAADEAVTLVASVDTATASDASGTTTSDIGHSLLDAGSYVPFAGIPAGIANAGWYAAEGQYGMAALSAAETIPGVKWLTGGVKLARRASTAIRTATAINNLQAADKPATETAPPQQATSTPRTAVSGASNPQIETFPAAEKTAPQIESIPVTEQKPQIHVTPIPEQTKVEPHVTPIPEQQNAEDFGGTKPVEHDTTIVASQSAIALPKKPDDLLKQGYNEVSHPDAKSAGYRTFENPTTGDRVRFDQGKAGQPGYEGTDHYHRYNPEATGKQDMYLDKDNNPCARGTSASHLLPGT